MVPPHMPNPNKVIHVMRRFTSDKWGGTESVVYNLSSQLLKRDIASPIFCTDMLSRSGVEERGAVLVHRFRYVFPWFGLSKAEKRKLELKGGSPLALGLFIGLMRERDVSVIHTHVQHRLGGMARTAARLKRIPYVVSLHGGYFMLPQEQSEKMQDPFRGKPEWGKLFGALFGSRRVLEDASAVICVGRDEYEAVRDRYPDKLTFLVSNGVDINRFSKVNDHAFRAAYGFQPSEKITLCVSRIDYQKNQLGLIRAFAEFKSAHPDHRLVLVGAVTVEAYRDELLAEIRRLELDSVVTLIEGLKPDDPLLASAYGAAEMFVLPSRHEPFGIVILEAWAAGVPVVANRIGGIPGFATDRENILFSTLDDDHELAVRMAELADQVSLRADLSRKAFGEVAAHYDWERITENFLKIYQQVLYDSEV